MKIHGNLRRRWPKDWPLQPVSTSNWAAQRPTYSDAKPSIINAALRRSQARPTGNWFVFAASRDVCESQPLGSSVAGVEIVAWRDRHRQLHVGPRSCPHLGADLATGTVRGDELICRWHGLALDGRRCDLGWRALPSYDDGVLAWVRLDSAGGETPLDQPVLPARPPGVAVSAVARAVGVCEPADIIANRLDPWHGAWFHPYSFSLLEVLSTPTALDDRFLVSVTFRFGRFGVPVIAEFTSTDARTIVMQIVDGEGVGSVVETHATPLGLADDGRPRTAVIEAVIASSERPGFRWAATAARVVSPLMRYAAARLWRDDLGYAERRYLVRTRR